MPVKGEVKERAVKSAVKERLIGTVGNMGEKLFALRERKRLLEESIKEIDEEYNVLAEQLMERMEKEGLPKASCPAGTMSISTAVVANVTDWDVFIPWARKTNNLHLFQRRISDAAWRELFESKGAIPGTEPFNKKRLNLRSA